MIKRYTIRQIASAAGVSPQTVSRVLNDRPDVAPKTRQHIKQIIQKLEYQPNALARSLIRQRSYTLGVVTAGLRFNGPSRTLNGIIIMAEELGYTILLKELPRFDSNHVEPLLQALLARQVDGIIWAVPEVGDNHNWVDSGLVELPLPIVFLTMDLRSNLSIINYDNYDGAGMAAQHLLQQGYRHIGHISGPLDWWESRQRKAGWQDSLANVGIDVLATHSVEGDWSASSGEAAFGRLQEQFPAMDAVFVANDQMALGVLRMATMQGIDIPLELGVVGFDGLAETAHYWSALSTVAEDKYLLGSTAVKEVVRVIEYPREANSPPQPKIVSLHTELLVRQSSSAGRMSHPLAPRFSNASREK